MPLGKLRAFLHTLFLENEEQTSQKKYRVMCVYSTENDMQNFRYFCKKQKNTSDRHLAWFCTQPFNWSFVSQGFYFVFRFWKKLLQLFWMFICTVFWFLVCHHAPLMYVLCQYAPLRFYLPVSEESMASHLIWSHLSPVKFTNRFFALWWETSDLDWHSEKVRDFSVL